MPAIFWHFERELVVGLRLWDWKAARPKERVVSGVEQKRGHGDVFEYRAGAGFLPVLVRIPKAKQRGRVLVVKVLKAVNAAKSPNLDKFRKHFVFDENLFSQASEQVMGIKKA